MKRFNIFILTIISAITGLLVLASCDNIVGLGTMLTMKGPVVKITSPVPAGDQKEIAVGDLFNLSGTATGEAKVTLIEVKMKYFDESGTLNDVGREWKWEKGSWDYKADTDIDWKPYAEDDYNYIDVDPERPVNPPSWRTDGNTVYFNLPMLMDKMPVPKEYYITISAMDSVGRRDANSTVKIKVNYDNGKPNFAVQQPVLLDGRGTGGQGNYTWSQTNPDYPTNKDEYGEDIDGSYLFDTYIYDPVNRPEETYNFIDKWVTEPMDFKWEINNDMIGEFKLTMEFANRHNFSNPTLGEEKKLYYRYEWVKPGPNDFLPKRGIFTDSDADPYPYVKIRNALTKDDIKLRDNSTGEPVQGGTLPKINGMYTPIQVVSRLTDGAGNTAHKSNGWFAYFPEADKPWALIDFAKKFDTSGQIPSNAPEYKYLWIDTDPDKKYTNENNYAYDNNGVASLRWELYKLKEDGTLDEIDATDKGEDGSKYKPWKGTVSDSDFLSGGNPPFKRKWGFKAWGSYGVGAFKIKVWVTDIKGIEGDEQVAFFTIETNTTPTVKTITNPSTSETLWGNTIGDFSIEGIAQIHDTDNVVGHNGIKVDRVSIVWIKPDPNQEVVMNRRLKYIDKSYENWDKYANNPGSYHKGYFEDLESKVWEADSIILDPLTDGNKNKDDQEDWIFKKTLNIFTDLEIGPGPGQNPHSDQEFLIRVLSKTGIGSQTRSSVYSLLTTRGKMKPPVLTIDKITITGNGITTVYDNDPDLGFSMLKNILPNFTLKVEGTWDDDSWEKWKGKDENTRRSFFKDSFKVTWRGQGAEEEIDLGGVFYNDKTWKSEYVFIEENEDAFVTINATLTDLKGNTGGAGKNGGGESMFAHTAKPTLSRITSSTNDGSYGENKATVLSDPNSRYIDIVLEFNNPVKFFENSQGERWPPVGKTPPYLELNNGGWAYYYEGNGDALIKFRYFINGTPYPPSYFPSHVAQSGFGGSSTSTLPTPRLHVNKIVWNNYSPSDLVGAEEGITAAIINDDFFVYGKTGSLSEVKNIVIDKIPPIVTGIVTGALETRPYGISNSLVITVNFDKDITVSGLTSGVTRAVPGNFYLGLKGGDLVGHGAKALYESSGARSVSFRYTVEDGDNTAGSSYLAVDSIFMDSGLSVKDLAGNEILKPVPVPAGGSLGKNIIIDTAPPARPNVSGITNNSNNYEARNFTITGLESNVTTVEYHLNCTDPGNPPPEGWISITPTPANGSATVTISQNGEYNIAVRQYDNAVPPNVSPVSSPLHFSIDTNSLLTRFSSSLPDGIYGFKTDGQVITIDLYSRIDLNSITGSPYLELNVRNYPGTQNRATLRGGQTGPKKVWTFEYTIPDVNVNTAKLDVTGIVTTGAAFTDSKGNNVTAYILRDFIKATAFSAQKNIVIQAGNPTASGGVTFNGTNELSATFDRDIFPGTGQVVVKQIASGYKIPTVMTEARWDTLFMNRTDIGQDLPASFGSDAEAKAATWQKLGGLLYQKGSNGASVSSDDLKPDTSVKYVLKYDIDTAAGDLSTEGLTGTGFPSGLTMLQVRNAMRAAEALRFNAKDKEVTISADKRTLKISLTGDKTLPVKGARYEWIFPRGFVIDVLGKPNNGADFTGIPGSDGNLTSGNPDSTSNTGSVNRSLAGLAEPVIRVNKGGDIDTMTGLGNNRQASQPLTTTARIDCRTPGATLGYKTRSTTDNVDKLIWRNGETGNLYYQSGSDTTTTLNTFGTQMVKGRLPPPPTGNNANIANGIYPYMLPNVGTPIATDYNSFDKSKRRPQSGNSASPYTQPTPQSGITLPTITNNWNGLNHWVPLGTVSAWGTAELGNYTGPFNLGVDDYNAGGMTIHILAQATGNGTSVNAYEIAYRSVFVFNNSTVNNNGTAHLFEASINKEGDNPPREDNDNSKLLHLGIQGGSGEATAPLPTPALGRMWIRGGDSTDGEPSVPDFPIARNRALPNKARLMTPINPGSYQAVQTNNANPPNDPVWITTPVTDNERPTNYDARGEYIWFWVTWGINVPAYVDPFYQQLPANNPPYNQSNYPRYYKQLYAGIIPFKEHYPVLAGRTTVFETRKVNRFRYGGNGGQLNIGAVTENPAPSDL